MSLSRETLLFRLAFVFIGATALALTVAPLARIGAAGWGASAWAHWSAAGIWALCALSALWGLRRLLPEHDPYLLPVVYVLTGWGLLTIWRLTPRFGTRQMLWLVVATAALLLITGLPGDLRWLRRYRYTWLLGGLLLTGFTLLFGVNPSGVGQDLWLGCCGLYLQPAEILKLLLVIFLAAYLADRREQVFAQSASLAYALPLLLMWAFSQLLLLMQRDLGMSALLFAVFVVMLYLASGQVRYVALGAGLLMLGGAIGYRLFDVVRLRVEAWWNPWADPSGRSYQIVQSLIALAVGGLLGRGLGQGAPTLIPVVHSDFILAALAEEWGLAGVVAVIALIALIVLRGLHIAVHARGLFRQLLAGGLAALIALQAFMIIGGVIKLVPLTGLTLPFLSYGGSSLVAHFIMIGLLLKLSSQAR